MPERRAVGSQFVCGPQLGCEILFSEQLAHQSQCRDPLWAKLERLGVTTAVHPTPGLRNPEWTSHGLFFEKIKDRLVQPIAPGGGGGPFAGGSGGAGQTTTFAGATPLGHPPPILAPWLDTPPLCGQHRARRDVGARQCDARL
jgi:hypothetical protein